MKGHRIKKKSKAGERRDNWANRPPGPHRAPAAALEVCAHAALQDAEPGDLLLDGDLQLLASATEHDHGLQRRQFS